MTHLYLPNLPLFLGDHNQLPPIIKNSIIQRFSNMEQSLFARLLRLKLPCIHLNHQGRCRPNITKLFGWRYPNLTNLPIVTQEDSIYDFGNAGFRYDYQFIDVPDYKGKGETAPKPYFY